MPASSLYSFPRVAELGRQCFIAKSGSDTVDHADHPAASVESRLDLGGEHRNPADHLFKMDERQASVWIRIIRVLFQIVGLRVGNSEQAFVLANKAAKHVRTRLSVRTRQHFGIVLPDRW